MDQFKDLVGQSKEWLRLEVEYYKLTAAEKFTVLMSSLIIGAICMFVGVICLVLFAFALVEVFKLFLSPALSFVCVGGIFLLLVVVLFLLRKPLLLNPIAKFITRLIISK